MSDKLLIRVSCSLGLSVAVAVWVALLAPNLPHAYAGFGPAQGAATGGAGSATADDVFENDPTVSTSAKISFTSAEDLAFNAGASKTTTFKIGAGTRLVIDSGGVTTTELLAETGITLRSEDAELTAGCVYTFTIMATDACAHNFRASTTTTIGRLTVSSFQEGGSK